MSGIERPGYENRIAEILADELGASLTYEWTYIDAARVTLTLLSGACDVIIGIGESASGVLNTVPFLRAPYVFASLVDNEIEIDSLDDAGLADLRIGTYGGGIPSVALQSRGLGDSVQEYTVTSAQGGPDYELATLTALLQDEVDIVVLYGPPVAAWAELNNVDLRMVAVSPEMEFAPSLLQFSRTWTAGVRPSDISLRDMLDVAIANRWDDIQAVISDYGIVQANLTTPVGVPPEKSGTRVGVVAPFISGAQLDEEILGEAARLGAVQAESSIGRRTADLSVSFDVLYASGPTDEAAIRAAARLASAAGVDAIVGGFGPQQVEAMGTIADRNDVLLFNIAATEDSLRSTVCFPRVFHIEASGSMYVSALIQHHDAADTWYVVHENTSEGNALLAKTEAALKAAGKRLVGSAAVNPVQFVYTQQISEISESEVDIALLLISNSEQSLFLSQFENSGGSATVTGLSTPESQTREALFNYTQVAPNAGGSARVLLWEASNPDGNAGILNETFSARSFAPMTATAWASYAAVMVMFEATVAGSADDVGTLREFLLAPRNDFDLGKEGLYFSPENQQLQQSLYAVQIAPDAIWGRTAAARTEVAQLLSEIAIPQINELRITGASATCN